MSEDTEAPEFIEISLTAEQTKWFIDQLCRALERSQLEAEMLRNQLERSKANE
ncbi:hypothetical protein LCGC14_1009380 [marine sediment metagenome]|uniref:Uncharacterized protein n=1 Tax=marine sediment metagenome TaxID=412755 RepID=A0A0F9N569_9ZZZZ